MHITSLAYFPVLVKVLHNELPWKCLKLDGLSTLFCIIVGNMTLYHTINTLCISTDYLVTRWQRLLVHNSGYFHKTHLFKVTNDPPVLFLHYRKCYSRPLESECATRTQIVDMRYREHMIFNTAPKNTNHSSPRTSGWQRDTSSSIMELLLINYSSSSTSGWQWDTRTNMMDLLFMYYTTLTQQQGLRLQLPVQNNDSFPPTYACRSCGNNKSPLLVNEISWKLLHSAVRSHEHLLWFFYLGIGQTV